MKKRGYSRAFTPRTERRIKIEIDRVPPTLSDALKAKARREGVSIRALTLQLWNTWAQRDTEVQDRCCERWADVNQCVRPVGHAEPHLTDTGFSWRAEQA